MTTSAPMDGLAARVRRTPDTRSYWRVALAVAAPLPWAAMGLVNVLQPFAGDEDFGSTVEKVRDNLHLVLAAGWMALPFFAFLVPSVLAVVAATRRRAPRLAAWGGTLTVVGFGMGLSGVGGGGTPLAVITVLHGFDVETMTRLDAAFLTALNVQLAGLCWVTALIIGRALLGLALWRSRVVAVIFPMALLAGGATHPFVPGGHLARICSTKMVAAPPPRPGAPRGSGEWGDDGRRARRHRNRDRHAMATLPRLGLGPGQHRSVAPADPGRAPGAGRR